MRTLCSQRPKNDDYCGWYAKKNTMLPRKTGSRRGSARTLVWIPGSGTYVVCGTQNLFTRWYGKILKEEWSPWGRIRLKNCCDCATGTLKRMLSRGPGFRDPRDIRNALSTSYWNTAPTWHGAKHSNTCVLSSCARCSQNNYGLNLYVRVRGSDGHTYCYSQIAQKDYLLFVQERETMYKSKYLTSDFSSIPPCLSTGDNPGMRWAQTIH